MELSGEKKKGYNSNGKLKLFKILCHLTFSRSSLWYEQEFLIYLDSVLFFLDSVSIWTLVGLSHLNHCGYKCVILICDYKGIIGFHTVNLHSSVSHVLPSGPTSITHLFVSALPPKNFLITLGFKNCPSDYLRKNVHLHLTLPVPLFSYSTQY